jgi:hypothetical protein
MALVSVNTALVEGDRYEDFLAQMREVKAHVERCGGQNVRLLSGLAAGETSRAVTFIVEGDDFPAIGSVVQKVQSDPKAMASMTGLHGTETGTALFENSFWTDVPL